ncbi:MAG: arginyl-tRNA synthetase [Parasphingorhabdus sp.]|jgi:arginyl-tRNA synthetase
MKDQVLHCLRIALDTLIDQQILPAEALGKLHIERTRQSSHGDYASNIALALAKIARCNPRQLAEQIIECVPTGDVLERCEIAGPGFINFFLKQGAYRDELKKIRNTGLAYGECSGENLPRVMVEFVSANPTGPLHVGHGRGAAYGDALARVLRKAGYETATEYYVNDAGRQMDILATSVWLRYLELCGATVDFPVNAYQGDYIFDIAATVHRENAESFLVASADLFADLVDDPERRIDELIDRAKRMLVGKGYQIIFEVTLHTLIGEIRSDLSHFKVDFDCWFSEKSLVTSGAIDRAVARLAERGLLYELDGAQWFRSSNFGDEKDRVVQRANGAYTYFASDIAYCLDKKERGFDQLIYIWGADHHGYITRTQAAFQALGHDPDEFTVLLVQFAVLYRGGEKVSMSTRGGDFVTLRELRQEVGNDAARFFYALRKPEQHMDFDLDLAKSRSNENPVYYVQYAHARVCSVFRQLTEKNIPHDPAGADLALLTEDAEQELMRELSRFPEVVESAARGFEPHQVAYYLKDLANYFHTYYNAHPFISSQQDVRDARLVLIDATRQVICNGLDLLGVTAPESM